MQSGITQSEIILPEIARSEAYEQELEKNMRSIDQQILDLLRQKMNLRDELDALGSRECTEDGERGDGERCDRDRGNEAGGSARVSHADRMYAAYAQAIADSREPVRNPKIVYQGEPGAFSEMAAIDFFGREARTEGKYLFEDTFMALRNGEADYAVLPIENSSTGAIRQVYDLLAQYECYLVGETTVNVAQNLMALPGVRMEDIQAVYSHEQGLFQCEPFLAQHRDWRRIPQPDTAGSAKMIAQTGNRHAAAICSARAAELYGLHILAPNINYNQHNTTRFVVISPRMELREGRDKICVSFTTAHQSGSLQEVLTIFTAHGLNLVRLESRPVQGRNWEYMFFVEFTGNLSELDEVMRELMRSTYDMRVFGNFRSNLE